MEWQTGIPFTSSAFWIFEKKFKHVQSPYLHLWANAIYRTRNEVSSNVVGERIPAL